MRTKWIGASLLLFSGCLSGGGGVSPNPNALQAVSQSLGSRSCEVVFEVSYTLPGSTSLAGDFTISNVPGVASILRSSCSNLPMGSAIGVTRQSSVARRGAILTLGALTPVPFDQFRIDGTRLVSRSSNACENGREVLYQWLDGGFREGSGRDIRLQWSRTETLSPCAPEKSTQFTL
jgi:hypothetical protein